MKDPQAELLEQNYSMSQLRKMYRDLYGVATTSKSKAKIAAKVAAKLAEDGNEEPATEDDLNSEPESESEPECVEDIADSGMDSGDVDVMAQRILKGISQAFEEVDSLKKARRSAVGEWREKMGKAKESIQDSLTNADLDAKGKLERIEAFWHLYQEAEARRTAVAKEYTERIKAATATMRKELDNAKQLPLF